MKHPNAFVGFGRVQWRSLRLPDSAPYWVETAALCFLAVNAAIIFMAAVSALYWPF